MTISEKKVTFSQSVDIQQNEAAERKRTVHSSELAGFEDLLAAGDLFTLDSRDPRIEALLSDSMLITIGSNEPGYQPFREKLSENNRKSYGFFSQEIKTNKLNLLFGAAFILPFLIILMKFVSDGLLEASEDASLEGHNRPTLG
jgi:hypothetical protein